MLAPSVHVHLPWDQLQQQGPSPQNDQPGPPGPLTPTSHLVEGIVCCAGTEPQVGTREFTNVCQGQSQMFPPGKI